ncbi:hypothetical protein Cgig2_006618 [Carnegiea gigantea]|uniref:Uncharacterized protein n=1 Tax=Carnegiea gigantea TaxID=171969 RepID=A0A9Q1JJ26_9CARY|nr:hypothetical protein Cgig2_006618 [Carnegiea gigantea]
MARGGKRGRPRSVLPNNSPDPAVVVQHEEESSTPSISPSIEAQLLTTINGTVIQQAPAANTLPVPLLSSYASMVDLDKNYIEFFNDNEILIRQHVTYEWKPVKCAHYHMFGHEEPVCKKKGEVRKEWRRVQREEPVTIQAQQGEGNGNDNAEYTLIPSEIAAR